MRSLEKSDLAAIAVGGVLGATIRQMVAGAAESDGGWFAYAPNASVTVGTNISGFERRTHSVATIDAGFGIPLDTLIVNVAGCLFLGALAFLLVRSTAVPRRVLLGAATGFCGSLTTFSLFAVELATMLRGRWTTPEGPQTDTLLLERATTHAVAYLLLSLGCGAIAFWLGRFGARMSMGERLP